MKTTDKNENDFRVGMEKEEEKYGPKVKKLIVILVPFFAIIWFVFSFGLVHYDMPYRGFNWPSGQQQPKHEPVKIDSEEIPKTEIDKLLSGLLINGFDENSCISRYNSALYRKKSPHNPSSALLSKLRAYETRHKQCGPDTESYRKALENLNSGKQSGPSDCNYIVWISFNGLGNRLLTIASLFLYALLTDRVLLLDSNNDISNLLCEPFPEASWMLPINFPLLSKMSEFRQYSNYSYGNMLKTDAFKNIDNTTSTSLLYLFLSHDYEEYDKLFFRDQDQSFFKKVSWLITKTDLYFVPYLFMIPSFEQDLINLFPEKELIFHFLGRYLFHPTNQVWSLITRFYEAYLENSNEKIGVQIRLLMPNPDSLDYVFDQVLSCLVNETILPEIINQENMLGPIKKVKTKSVLVTSLYSSYYERLRDLYWENPTTTGEVVRFFQPSHEKHEQNKNKMHNMKAWAEIYLLSLTDKLVTSAESTFGYVATSLGGLRPWILYKSWDGTVPNPPCRRALSMEPCNHGPPTYDYKTRTQVYKDQLVPYVRTCEDLSWGVKLFDDQA